VDGVGLFGCVPVAFQWEIKFDMKSEVQPICFYVFLYRPFFSPLRYQSLPAFAAALNDSFFHRFLRNKQLIAVKHWDASLELLVWHG
jgi:hypothetical protein